MSKRRKEKILAEDGFWSIDNDNNSPVPFDEGMWLTPDEIKQLKESENSKSRIQSEHGSIEKWQVESTSDESIPKKKKKSDPLNNNKTKTTQKPIDVERLRDDYESNTEWNLRRQFITAHLDSFPLDRLICLSRCFINTEVYSCKYPEAVSLILVEMRAAISDVIIDQKDRLKSKYEVTFVKATDPELHTKPSKRSKKVMINFVKAGVDFQSLDFDKSENNTINSETDQPGQISCHKPEDCFKAPISLDECNSLYGTMQERVIIANKEEKLCMMGTELKKISDLKKESNPVSKLYEAAQKVRLVPHSDTEVGSDGFLCQVYIDNIPISKSSGRNKKAARNSAHELAVAEIMKPYCKLIGSHPDRLTFCASDKPFESDEPVTNNAANGNGSQAQKPKEDKPTKQVIVKVRTTPYVRNMGELRTIKRSLSKFFLRELDPESFNLPLQCLRQTCDFLKIAIEFCNSSIKHKQVKSVLSINHQVVSEGIGDAPKIAEQEAAYFALEKLRDVHWTIKFKGQFDCEDEKMSKDSIMDVNEVKAIVEEFEHGKKLSDSNIGSKLMKKMGWNGRGIGKNQQGREDPVLVKQVVRRSGLGALDEHSSQKELETVIFKIVSDYYYSYEDTDLAFAPDFSSDERKIIHDKCRRFGLKSKSYGSGEDRYLVISRQRSSQELYQYILSKGGETPKYKLVPPRIEEFK